MEAVRLQHALHHNFCLVALMNEVDTVPGWAPGGISHISKEAFVEFRTVEQEDKTFAVFELKQHYGHGEHPTIDWYIKTQEYLHEVPERIVTQFTETGKATFKFGKSFMPHEMYIEVSIVDDIERNEAQRLSQLSQ
jgi:hypothetical protein